MVASVRQRVQVKCRHSSGDGGPSCEEQLNARRFMGVLLHPVPHIEMYRECGVDRPGAKVLVEWPPGRDHCDVQAGDRLEVEGQTYTILGVKPHSGLYLELYVDA